MTNLRKIAEALVRWQHPNVPRPSTANARFSINDEEAIALLDALVEERRKFLEVQSLYEWICAGKIGPSPSMFIDDYTEKALRELNLEGVGLEKEEVKP